jgi:hypothetical protein
MRDAERCAVIGLRSGIVPNEPNTFFDGCQKKFQFFSWLTVSIRIIYSLYEHIQLTTTFCSLAVLASADLRAEAGARFSTASHLILRFVS